MLASWLSLRPRVRHRLWLLGVPVVLCAAVIGACGGDDGSGGSGDRDYRLVHIPTGVSEFTVTIRAGAEAEARKLGVEYDFQLPANPDIAGQTATLNAVIASKPDAILVEPIDTEGVLPALRAAKQRGIKVVTYDSNVKDESVPDSFIANDYVESGRHIAEQLLELTDSKGAILHIAAIPGIGFTQKLLEGYNEVMKSASGVELLPVAFAEGEPARANSIMAATLSRHPDLAGAYLDVLPEQKGALTALRAANAVDKVKTIGWDASPEGVKLLKAGDLDVIISTPAHEYGVRLIRTAVDLLDGKKVPKFQPLEDCIMTKETVDDPSMKGCIYLPLK